MQHRHASARRLLIGTFGLIAAGCSHHHSTPDPALRLPANQPNSPCHIIGVTYVDLVHGHTTFEQVATGLAGDRYVVGVGAGLALSGGAKNSDTLGVYEPAVNFIAKRYEGTAKNPPSAAVIASAKRLDSDLARGLCTGYKIR